MNGANGIRDIEGKAAMGSGEKGGSRTSFKHRWQKRRFVLLSLWERIEVRANMFLCL